jgi:hypothetical protein
MSCLSYYDERRRKRVSATSCGTVLCSSSSLPISVLIASFGQYEITMKKALS